jgi:hypothetical protein
VDVIDFIKRIANEKQAEAAWLYDIVRPALHFVWKHLFAPIAHAHPHAFSQSFHAQRNDLIVAQTVSVTNNVRACFVHAENHQEPFFFRERITIEKLAYTVAQQGKIGSITAEFDFLPLDWHVKNVSRFRNLIQLPNSKLLTTTRSDEQRRCRKGDGQRAKGWSIFGMWRGFIALLLLGTQAWAQDNATAYEALRVVGSQLGRGALEHIVAIAGTKGNPQPEKWKIVLEDPQGRGVRELQIVDGKIDSDDQPDESTVGSAEGATINIARLNLDSSGAFAVASHTAEASHTQFSTADYTLRTDERGEPVWIVTLLSRSGRPVGTIHIGATHGTVKRTEGMFAGATMEDVENDYDEGDGTGVISDVKRKVKRTFHRTQEEARGMFEKVKRSFSDFINRE